MLQKFVESKRRSLVTTSAVVTFACVLLALVSAPVFGATVAYPVPPAIQVAMHPSRQTGIVSLEATSILQTSATTSTLVAGTAGITATSTLSTSKATTATVAPAAKAKTVTYGVAANIPISLSIPAIAWTTPITPMGWENTIIDDKITTRWVVPLDAGGWAVNSAAAGESGNLVIAGNQTLGKGLFRPIALGVAEKGQEIWVRSADGRTHIYRITAESTPIPAIGATSEEIAQAQAYLLPADQPRLTIVTGWPADTSTHRIFVVAEYVGIKK
ncbi:MAG: class F sortase [Anaerolineales bacterium]|nr:class F sortase [Anaerolineales bacterium]